MDQVEIDVCLELSFRLVLFAFRKSDDPDDPSFEFAKCPRSFNEPKILPNVLCG